jgi:pyruvate dehydrogenase E2 component (dihydrolipoamide acetyltransferase)
LTECEKPATYLVEVTMPRLSDSMEEATILRWLKRPGEAVARGEPLVEVETDKATIVYEAEVAGVLSEIAVPADGTAALGAVIARLAIEHGGATGAREAAEVPARPAAPAISLSPVQRSARDRRTSATPVARRIAVELGVELEGLSGTGPGGRIVEADVRRAARRRPIPKAIPGERGEEILVEQTTTQRTIAERMTRSRRQIPDFTLEVELDMQAATALREDLRSLGREPLPSFNDVIVRAVALCLREFPALNAAHLGDRIVRYSRINVGIAVATDDALLVPTIFDADRKSVFEIAAASRALVEQVRDRSVRPEDLGGGTFTVSNLGMFGVRRFTAVINPPQTGILAVGAVERRPTIGDDGTIVVGTRMDVALSCDHRVVYGAEAALFLQRLEALVEHPVGLIADLRETYSAGLVRDV